MSKDKPSAAKAGDLDGQLEQLYRTILQRREADPQTSYIARLRQKGRAKMAQKVGEEAVETALAAVGAGEGSTKHNVISESADLMLHLLALWADCHVTPADIAAELAAREGQSGLDEKAKRKG